MSLLYLNYFSFLQNDLEEFFAMVNFTNPGILGDATYFRRYYEVWGDLMFDTLIKYFLHYVACTFGYVLAKVWNLCFFSMVLMGNINL